MKYQSKKVNTALLKTSLKNKIPRNKMNQSSKDLYSENYKTMMKENEDYSKKWEDVQCSWIGKKSTLIIKMAILLKITNRFNASLSKHQGYFSQN